MEACPYCGGQLRYLGGLGSRVHLRCRDCGRDCSFLDPDTFREFDVVEVDKYGEER